MALKTHVLWPIFAAASLAIAGCNQTASQSGDYIAADDSGAFLVQLDPAKEGRVEGSVTVALVDSNGRVSSNTIPLSGTLKGNALNVVARNGTGIFSSSLPMTGSFSGGLLNLTLITDGKAKPLALRPADSNEFPALVEKLSERSNVVQANVVREKEERDAQKRLNAKSAELARLTSAIEESGTRIAENPSRIAADSAGYSRLAAKASKLKREWARLSPDVSQEDVRRSQIEIEVDQIGYDAETKHREISDYWTALRAKLADFDRQATAEIARCDDALYVQCDQLGKALAGYRILVNKSGEAVAKDAAAYKASGLAKTS